jgi:hypothetical protein
VSRCKVCGEPHKACGPSLPVAPVDERISERGIQVALNRYEVTTGGRHPQKATLVLSDEDAERLGVKKAEAEDKTRKPRNKAAQPAADK